MSWIRWLEVVVPTRVRRVLLGRLRAAGAPTRCAEVLLAELKLLKLMGSVMLLIHGALSVIPVLVMTNIDFVLACQLPRRVTMSGCSRPWVTVRKPAARCRTNFVTTRKWGIYRKNSTLALWEAVSGY